MYVPVECRNAQLELAAVASVCLWFKCGLGTEP